MQKTSQNVRSWNFYKGCQDREEKAVDKGSNLERKPFKQRFPEDSLKLKSWFLEKDNIVKKSF